MNTETMNVKVTHDVPFGKACVWCGSSLNFVPEAVWFTGTTNGFKVVDDWACNGDCAENAEAAFDQDTQF